MEAQVETVRRDALGTLDIDALDIETIVDADTQARIAETAQEGRDFLPALADWGRRARPLLDQSFPDEVYEDAALNGAVMSATGLGALNDIMLLIGMVIGDPDVTSDETVATRLLHQYADLIGSDRGR